MLSLGKSFFNCSPESLTIVTILLENTPVISFFSSFNLTSDAISEIWYFAQISKEACLPCFHYEIIALLHIALHITVQQWTIVYSMYLFIHDRCVPISNRNKTFFKKFPQIGDLMISLGNG